MNTHHQHSHSHGQLSRQYESNGNPSCISSGIDDPGGKSYGAYQLSSAYGIVQDFLNWLGVYHPQSPCTRQLLIYIPLSPAFDDAWTELGNTYSEEFLYLQQEYIEWTYFIPAAQFLSEVYFHIDRHSYAMGEVLWSRSVQYGPYQMVDLFRDAVHRLGYPNLSYVDHIAFDWDMIVAIYEVCSTYEWNCGPFRNALNDRFEQECHDAIQLLQEEP